MLSALVALVAAAAMSFPAAIGAAGSSPKAVPAAVPPLGASAAAVSPSLRLWTDCVARVNVARTAAGRQPVAIDARLATAATGHSGYQAQMQKMTHTGSGGTNGGQRIAAAGFVAGGWAENVAAGQADCASVVAAWLASPTHRTNILNTTYRYIGIGNVVGANGVHYWTMDLAV